MFRPGRLFLIATAFVALLLAPTARADHQEVKSCGPWFYIGTDTPMVETGDIQTFTVLQNGNWTTLIQSCDVPLSPSELTMTYNLVWRYWLVLKSSTIPVGTPYEVELATIDREGVITVRQVIKRRIQHLSSESQPHAEYLAAYVPGLTGAHGYTIRIRFPIGGPGSAIVDVGNFAAMQGSKSEFGGARNTLTPSMTLDTTWREIGFVTMTNSSGAAVDVQLQGHFTVTSGTPGAGISVGIGKGLGSSGNHYSRAFVPKALPEEITILDYMPNEGVGMTLIPNGSTTFRMWAKVDAGTAVINNRRLEVLGMDADPEPDTERYVQFAGGPTVLAEDTTQPQPQACFLHDDLTNPYGLCDPTRTPLCGRWTKVFEGKIDPNPLGVASIGAGHIEITGRSCRNGGTACWPAGETRMNVAIEMITNPDPRTGYRAASDFHASAFSVANLPMKIHFFSDGFHWGNDWGQTVRLWVRLIDTPCNGVHYQAQERRLTIGRSYLGLRFFYPTGTLANPLK